MLTQSDIIDFFDRQLATWPEAAARFAALDDVLEKRFDIDGFTVTVTHNPARMRSSAAKVDKGSIAARPCFLCDANRPQQQQHIDWRGYRILVNPFPILPRHFTIVAKEHRPQSIAGAIADMTALAQLLPDFAIFYNGPACGASAPDHFHFQAVEKKSLPMFSDEKIPFGVIRSVAPSQADIDNILSRLPLSTGETEPKVNIFCTVDDGTPVITIIPRRKHRPDFYGEEGMLISPASIDLTGVIVAPRRTDYDRIDADIIKDIYSQLCFTRQETDNLLNDNNASK